MSTIGIIERVVESMTGIPIETLRNTPSDALRAQLAPGPYGGLHPQDRSYVLTSDQINASLDEALLYSRKFK